jgi:hypothetical protein
MRISLFNKTLIVLSCLITLNITLSFCPFVEFAFSNDSLYDHLKCYKIKDVIKVKAVVDIDAAEFGLEEGCVVGKAKQFCVPAIKTVVQGPSMNINGQAIGNTFICYRIRCKGRDSEQEMQITDQFGNKIMVFKSERQLCVPACIPSPEICDDRLDNDCDGAVDCFDEEDCCSSGVCIPELRQRTVTEELYKCVGIRRAP